MLPRGLLLLANSHYQVAATSHYASDKFNPIRPTIMQINIIFNYVSKTNGYELDPDNSHLDHSTKVPGNWSDDALIRQIISYILSKIFNVLGESGLLKKSSVDGCSSNKCANKIKPSEFAPRLALNQQPKVGFFVEVPRLNDKEDVSIWLGHLCA